MALGGGGGGGGDCHCCKHCAERSYNISHTFPKVALSLINCCILTTGQRREAA